MSIEDIRARAHQRAIRKGLICRCGHKRHAHPNVGRHASWPTRCVYCDCMKFTPLLDGRDETEEQR